MTTIPDELLNTIHHADCFDLLAMIPDGAVDAIITDLPYGTTACAWDTVIPFAPMWAAVKRVLKPRGVFVTTASQPFTSALVMSNPKWFKYSWVWDKSKSANFFNAPYQPLKTHEDIVVFSGAAGSYSTNGSMAYYPTIGEGLPYSTQRTAENNHFTYNQPRAAVYRDVTTRYPVSILDFPADRPLFGKQPADTGFHGTQKPVALYEYLIRTYTQADDVVLDFCCGSGTTAVAARNTGRRYIAGDSSAEYVAIARDRLRMPFEPRQVEPKSAPLEDLPLFTSVESDTP